MRASRRSSVVAWTALAACVLAAVFCSCGRKPKPAADAATALGAAAPDSSSPETAAPAAPLATGPARTVELALSTWNAPRSVGVAAAASVSLDASGRGELEFPPGGARVAVGRRGARVIVDADGDGQIDAADGRGASVGKVLTVGAVLDGKRAEYPLRVVHATREEVRFASAAGLVAEVDGHRVTLLDPDMNARFGEAGRDRIVVDRVGAGEHVPDPCTGPAEAGLPLGRIHAIGEDLYEVELVGDAKALSLAPVLGEKALVECAADGSVVDLELTLAHAREPFSAQLGPGAKTAMLAGDYHVRAASVTLRLEGGPGTFHALTGAGATVKIAPGRSTLRPGPPFELDFSASLSGVGKTDLTVDSPALVGGAGERYLAILRTGGAASSLTVSLRSRGEETPFGKLEYG